MNELHSTIDIVKYVCARNYYRIPAILSAIAFAIFWMFFTGIIIVSTRPISDTIPIPFFHVITNIAGVQSIGYVPWIIWYPNKYTVFSMNSSAMITISLVSALIAINVAMLLYRRKLMKDYSCSCISGAPLLAGIIPGCFGIFACCGGGLVLSIFGPLFFASLFGLGGYLNAITILALLAGVFLTARGMKPVHLQHKQKYNIM